MLARACLLGWSSRDAPAPASIAPTGPTGRLGRTGCRAACCEGAHVRRRWPLGRGRGPFVLERRSTAQLVEAWSHGTEEDASDPFGLVLWPGAIVLAGLVGSSGLPVRGRSVVELGAGTGLCALTAAARGAAEALATDLNPLTLELIKAAAAEQALGVKTSLFDLCGSDALPGALEVVLAADVCYNARVARALARRCEEVVAAGATAVVADSVDLARSDFTEELLRLDVPHTRTAIEHTCVVHAVLLDDDVESRCDVALFQFG